MGRRFRSLILLSFLERIILRHSIRPVDERDLDGGHRTHPHLTLELEAAMMPSYDGVHDGEPQSRPSRFPRAGLVHPVKALSEVAEVLLRDTHTAVSDLHLGQVLLLPST